MCVKAETVDVVVAAKVLAPAAPHCRRGGQHFGSRFPGSQGVLDRKNQLFVRFLAAFAHPLGMGAVIQGGGSISA